MSSKVPWTYPGGPACCCVADCDGAFDTAFWGNVAEANTTLISITSEMAATIFAGGDMAVDISAGLSVAGTGGCDFLASASVSGARSVINEGGCARTITAQINSAISGATATSTVSVTPVGANTFPTGSVTDNSAYATVFVSYQIVKDGANYGLYLGLSASINTGLVQIPQTGGVTFQGGGAMQSNMTFTGGSGSASAVFVGNTVSSSGYFYQVEGNYGLNTVVSGNGSLSASLAFVSSAP